MPVLDFWAVMPTCAARNSVRLETQKKLNPHGIVPTMFACETLSLTPRQRHNQNLADIGAQFSERREPYLLYLEDDLDVAPTFHQWLTRAMLGELECVSFFNPNRNFYQPAVLKMLDNGKRPPASFYEAAGKGSWYSALAVLMSRRAFNEIWRHVDFAGDVSLDNAIPLADVTLHCAVPNPIDHQDVPSATSATHWGGRVRSISFDA